MTADVSLRELIEARLAAHERLHVEHNAAHDREHKATEMAIAKAETATAAALDRAEEVLNARFAAQNEWRGAFSDRERAFATKSDVEASVNARQAAIAALTTRLDKLEDAEIARATREDERQRAQTRMTVLVGIAASVGGFVLSLLTRLLGIGA